MGTNTNESEVKCVNNIIGRNASLASAPKLWSGFGMIKWMTFLLELQRPVVHLKEWTWEKIFTQANTQEVFGAISKDVPISLRSATCAHKGLGGAPNKTLKIYV
jgi:hypothetical protein